MSYYRTCPCCAANLDPGEACDCNKKAAPELEPLKAAQENNLFYMIIEEAQKVNAAS